MPYHSRCWLNIILIPLALCAACAAPLSRPPGSTTTPVRPSPPPTTIEPAPLGDATIHGSPDGNPAFPDFPQQAWSAAIPHDVDNFFLLQNQDETVRQRLFDILSWQTFLALNWPVNEAGVAQTDFTDAGAPAWTTWKVSTQVLLPDGRDPGPWDAAPPAPSAPCLAARAHLTNLDVTATGRTNLLDTRTQADAQKLWDQNGNLVYYEILIDQPEYDYIRQEGLYHINGQIDFTQKRETLYFPTGKYWRSPAGSGVQKDVDPADQGVIELKLAWKILDPSQDIASRFYTETACIQDEQGAWREQVVGLVGMHIAHRTFAAAQWVWATFEQSDNTQVDPAEVAAYARQGQVLKPSFYDPDCTDCQPNTVQAHNGISKTQVVPVLAPLAAVQPLNQQVQQQLKALGSPWQYYRLIGTQWPPDANSNGAPQPLPAALANPVLETYVPKAQASCMNCHYAAALAVALQTQPDGTTQVQWGAAGSADFSFLLMKAE